MRNPLVLAAAHLAGVTRAFTIGGAQAIAALAYGTATVPAVDKICGPGNAYVAAAKRRVFGTVGIDMVAGVSEVLVIADATANPDWIAIDLFAQAEHDEMAQAILLTPDAALIDRLRVSGARLIGEMPRAQIIAASLERRGALIRVRDLDEACARANRIAPEHLELAVAEPDALAAADPARRRDLRRPLCARSARRLLRRSEPRAADRTDGALLVAARRLRFPETHQRAAHFARGRTGACTDCFDARARRRPDRPRAVGRSAMRRRLRGRNEWPS